MESKKECEASDEAQKEQRIELTDISCVIEIF